MLVDKLSPDHQSQLNDILQQRVAINHSQGPPLFYYFMNCTFWNVRGLNSKEKQLDTKKFLANSNIPIISLVETKVSTVNTLPIQRKILPGYLIHNPTSSGRIWVCWQPQSVDLTLLMYSEQYVHCKVIPSSGGSTYFLTTIYASNSVSERQTLWQDLTILASGIGNSPWIIGGDFNDIRYSNEKVGGRPAHSRRLARFNQCISDCNLQDLKATGNLYSWHNNQTSRIACKLDRVMVNNSWLLSFADSFVQFQAPGLSDHSVLQVVVKPRLSSGPRPFKYFQLWEDRTDFLNLVTTAWSYKVIGSPMFILAKKLQHLKIIIKKWNFEVFGPIQHTLSMRRQELNQAQDSLMQNPIDLASILHESTAKAAYL
ncbi:hypothetical protein QJS10_CPA01g01631 [Acorus calamus]|uniref:Endonuclease/exonuclease/phosphatase domain-containing protein n=1 Tax=Acorus calamus TaxID=4465 RepID=A0AAV9FM56_ACOCL|nr:hypothetical protein QJS10_CPA01g01631 [Acorus calamus]